MASRDAPEGLEGPSKKRPRTSKSLQCNKIGQEHGGFLSRYNSERPIIVALKPIRRLQQKVIVRNLRRAGAKVLDIEEACAQRRFLINSEIIVVTEDQGNAQIAVREKIGLMANAVYVSREWATKVLTEQEWRPETQYILEQAQEERKPTQFSASDETAIDLTHSEGGPSEGIPVWCRRRLDENIDPTKKAEFLASLPKFLCERCTITQAVYKAPNHQICEILEIIAKKRRLEQAGGSVESADIRGRAYQRASAALKCVPFKLRTAQDAKTLYSLGPRVLATVKEYLTTGAVKEVQLMETDSRLKALAKYQGVYGIGYVKARRFYDELGVRNMKQLVDMETQGDKGKDKAVVCYLKYVERIQSLSAQDAVAFKDTVYEIANSGDENDLHLRFQLCGGFRRERKTDTMWTFCIVDVRRIHTIAARC
ncbi:DNA polymerase lambda lyase [Gracilaria domingensis]|nr:DNA polymerase lambda lyase [Gracilaria domingensis]